MIRRGLAQFKAQERPQRQRVGCPPGDAPFRIDTFEIPNQKGPKVNSRGKTRTARFRVKRCACRFGKRIESPLTQYPVQTLIERVSEKLLGSTRAETGPKRP